MTWYAYQLTDPCQNSPSRRGTSGPVARPQDPSGPMLNELGFNRLTVFIPTGPHLAEHFKVCVSLRNSLINWINVSNLNHYGPQQTVNVNLNVGLF